MGALFGTLKIGAVVVMVNPQLKADDVAYFFDYTRARVAVVAGEALEAFATAASGARWLKRLLVVGGRREGHASFDEEAASAPEALDNVATHRDDAAVWLFSGGTTGRPKAVVQTHLSFANTTELYAKATLGYGETDVTLSVPKLFFGYATGSNLFFPFSVGGTSVLFPEHPTPDVLFEKIRRHRPTVLVNVPTVVNQMVSHPEASKQDLSSLRFATSAGEALPPELYRRWKETFGVELLDGLGTAEMWHIFLTNRVGDVKPGTLGKPVAGFDVKVADDEGRELPPGETGLLWVRGRSRAIGYWQQMDKTAAGFRGEWYVTGDLVVRDDEGYFTHCGRADEMLKVSGRWVAPQEVEGCLLQHASVKECAVVGVQDATGLVKPHAYVVARERERGWTRSSRPGCATASRPTSTRARSCSWTRCRARTWARWTGASCAAAEVLRAPACGAPPGSPRARRSPRGPSAPAARVVSISLSRPRQWHGKPKSLASSCGEGGPRRSDHPRSRRERPRHRVRLTSRATGLTAVPDAAAARPRPPGPGRARSRTEAGRRGGLYDTAFAQAIWRVFRPARGGT